MSNDISITGARQNNLKDLDLKLPLERVTCITGPSGSGKSSLAFETLYAEGYRRYVESLSTYARQFFERLPKPDVDTIDHIPPSIALEQKNSIKNSRSTLGTTTEIYDYLRLLFAKLGDTYCPSCAQKIQSYSPQRATDSILESLTKEKERTLVGFPLKKKTSISFLIERGFLRKLRSKNNPSIIDLEEIKEKELPAGSLIVLDRMLLSPNDQQRLIDALESSFREGEGKSFVLTLDNNRYQEFETKARCTRCDIDMPKFSPLSFSFNSPLGACPTCKGFGNVLEYDESLIVPQPHLSIQKGAIDPLTKKILKTGRKQFLEFAKKKKIPLDKPYQDLSKKQKNLILYGENSYKGVVGSFKKLERKKYKLYVRVFLRRYQSQFACKTCYGARLKPESLWVKVQNKNIYQLVQMPLGELEKWFQSLRFSEARSRIHKEIFRQIRSRLHFLNEIGLHYLNLHRLSKTLSGGEIQRTQLANQLGAELSGTLYVLDEPSIGLHAVDRNQVLDALRVLSSRGNTVVLVEHDLETISRSDYVFELGPGSGRSGGKLVFHGSQKQFKKSDCLTALYLNGKRKIEAPKKKRNPSERWIQIQGASENNLKDINLKIPLQRLIGVSGVSGSGKSTLIEKTLYQSLARLFHQATETIGKFEKLFGADQIKDVFLLDQNPPSKSTRSIPLSVIGGYDEVRTILSQTSDAVRRSLRPAHFSFNVSKGRCETCHGEGVIKTEMFFLEDIQLTCEDCRGKRFKKNVLEVRYRRKNINDIFQMTASEAKQFFSSSPNLYKKFSLLEEVGLGYVQLGQASSQLSGGERQRLKIAAEFGKKNQRDGLYILDEPTTGLHMSEIQLLINLLNKLVDQGNTVIVIEHHLDVLRHMDWLIDLGPGAGEHGGKIVGEGSPQKIAKLNTPTGKALRGESYSSSSSRPVNS